MTTSPAVSSRAALVLLIAATALVLAIGPILASAWTGSAADASPAPDETTTTVAAGTLRVEPANEGTGVPFVSAPSTTTTTTTAPPPEPGEVHVCPVPSSEFIDSWGFARSGGRRHKGVDMMAGYGDPVLAPTDGVIRVSNSTLGGLGFYLDGFDGTTYFGSHLATLDHTGLVSAGMQIGTVGTSGNASSPHLHFEVHPGGGSAVNPFPYTNEWCQIPDWTEPDPVQDLLDAFDTPRG